MAVELTKAELADMQTRLLNIESAQTAMQTRLAVASKGGSAEEDKDMKEREARHRRAMSHMDKEGRKRYAEEIGKGDDGKEREACDRVKAAGGGAPARPPRPPPDSAARVPDRGAPAPAARRIPSPSARSPLPAGADPRIIFIYPPCLP